MNDAQPDFRDEELLAAVGRRPDRRRAARRGRQRLADPGDRGAAGARARPRAQSAGPTCRCSAAASTSSGPTAARELFDCAGQGRIDVFFLSGGEIDGQGNINLVSIGDPENPTARFPGSFGSSYLYFVVPKVILFRTEHSKRTLVPKVSFISAPGGSDDNVYRTGGPIALITNRCLFSFDRRRAALPARKRASRPYARRGDRQHRLRVRPPAGRAGDAGAVGRDAAADAGGGGAGTGRGLSAVRRAGCSASGKADVSQRCEVAAPSVPRRCVLMRSCPARKFK